MAKWRTAAILQRVWRRNRPRFSRVTIGDGEGGHNRMIEAVEPKELGEHAGRLKPGRLGSIVEVHAQELRRALRIARVGGQYPKHPVCERGRSGTNRLASQKLVS